MTQTYADITEHFDTLRAPKGSRPVALVRIPLVSKLAGTFSVMDPQAQAEFWMSLRGTETEHELRKIRRSMKKAYPNGRICLQKYGPRIVGLTEEVLIYA